MKYFEACIFFYGIVSGFGIGLAVGLVLKTLEVI